MVIINGDGGNGNESPNLGGREAFVEGGGRRNGRCVSGSAVVGREAPLRQGTRQGLGETRYYSFLCPPGLGGRRTLSVAEAKREVGANFEEV